MRIIDHVIVGPESAWAGGSTRKSKVFDPNTG